MTNAKSTATTPRKAPAKKAPAKKAPAGVKKAALLTPDWKPSSKRAKADGKGAAAEHRQWTEEFAILNGYQDLPEAGPYADRVIIIEKGDTRFRVEYSTGGFVQKVEGAATIVRRDSGKWIGLNTAIAAGVS